MWVQSRKTETKVRGGGRNSEVVIEVWWDDVDASHTYLPTLLLKTIWMWDKGQAIYHEASDAFDVIMIYISDSFHRLIVSFSLSSFCCSPKWSALSFRFVSSALGHHACWTWKIESIVNNNVSLIISHTHHYHHHMRLCLFCLSPTTYIKLLIFSSTPLADKPFTTHWVTSFRWRQTSSLL